MGVPPASDSDLTLEALRSRRDRRAVTSTIAAITARGIVVIGSIITIPLAIGYLGVERYGVFVALTAVTSMFVFADLGLGNGLLNVVSEANGRDDRATAKKAVSSAFFMLLAVAVILAIGFAIAYPSVDWAGFLNVSGRPAIEEVGPTAAVLISLFVVALPLGVTERLRMAYQEGFINSVASMAGAVLGLIGMLVAIAIQASLPMLVLATSLPPLLALAANGYSFFRRERPWLWPGTRLADRTLVVRLARLGFLFLILQLAVAVAFQSDIVVAAAVLGPDAAATFAVTLKVFMLVPTLVAMYLTTLWPAYTEALARGDAAWVKRTLRRSMVIAALTTGASSVVLVIAGAWVIETWTGGAIEPPVALLVGASIWAVISATFNAIGILLNAASVILFQVGVAIVMAAASITLSILFANAFGLSGIIFGTLIAYVLCTALPIVLYLPKLLGSIGVAPVVRADD